MSNEATLTRRGFFMKLGILFNGVVAAALAVPVVQFLLSSITRGRAGGFVRKRLVGGRRDGGKIVVAHRPLALRRSSGAPTPERRPAVCAL